MRQYYSLDRGKRNSLECHAVDSQISSLVREKTGFCGSSLRFSSQVDDKPGPGAYDGGYSSVGPRAKSASSAMSTVEMNKKGYGPLASGASRFRRRAGYTGPGPGEYGLVMKGVGARDGFNRAGNTGAFHPPIRPIDPTKCVDNGIPGPGPAPSVTNTGEKVLGKGPGHASSFKALPHRLDIKSSAAAPPPGTYELVDLWDGHHGAAASRTPSRAGLSSFAGRSVSTSLAQFSSPLMFLDPLGELGSDYRDSGPGPGSYEIQEYGSIKKKLAEKRGVSAKPLFSPPEFTDKFGRPLDDRRADLSLVPLSTGEASKAPARLTGPAPGVSAPFVSTSPGRDQWDLKEATKAPGPAFYSPNDPTKKISYHASAINSRKRYDAPRHG